MTGSKIIELFRAMTPRQLSRLGDFLRSPYFNKNTDCVLLYDYLQKYAPDFSHPNIARQIVVKKLPTEKPLDDRNLAHLSSRLLALVEKFLVAEDLYADEGKQRLALLQEYQARNLPKHYKSVQSDIEKQLEAAVVRDADYYQKSLVVKRLFYEHGDRNQRGFDERLQAAADALDTYFVAEKLRFVCEMLNYETLLNIRYETNYWEEVLQWSAATKYEKVTTIQVYRRLLLLLAEPDDTANFKVAKSLVVASGQSFHRDELRQLYTHLLNYCALRINRHNDQHFLNEHLEINKLMLSNGLIFDNDLLPPWKYTNLVTVGLKTGQVEWTRQFIHEYQKRLPEEYRDNTFRYNLAQHHYYLKNYDEAQRALLQVEFTDVLLNVSARSLLIKIYCETEQTELLLSYLEATRIFLLRNPLLDAHIKRQMQKFVEFTTKFVKIAPHDKMRYQTLAQLLPPAQEILHRDWLAGQFQKKLSGR